MFLCQHFIAKDAKVENNKDFKDAFHRSFFFVAKLYITEDSWHAIGCPPFSNRFLDDYFGKISLNV